MSKMSERFGGRLPGEVSPVEELALCRENVDRALARAIEAEAQGNERHVAFFMRMAENGEKRLEKWERIVAGKFWAD